MHPYPYYFSYALAAGTLVCLLGGLYLCGFGASSQRKYDFLKDPPLVWINGIQRGFVQIRGKANLDAPLISPLTESPCCYHRTTIECVKKANESGLGSYRRISDETKGTQFVIDDGTGKVMVLPRGAEYEFPKTYSAEIDLSLPGLREEFLSPGLATAKPPREEALRDYLSRHAITEPTPRGGGDACATVTYRLTEYCLPAGQEVSVFGTCEKCYGPRNPGGYKIICKNEHLPVLAITTQNELTARPRLRYIAIASFSTGIMLIGLSVAGTLFLIYRHFV